MQNRLVMQPPLAVLDKPHQSSSPYPKFHSVKTPAHSLVHLLPLHPWSNLSRPRQTSSNEGLFLYIVPVVWGSQMIEQVWWERIGWESSCSSSPRIRWWISGGISVCLCGTSLDTIWCVSCESCVHEISFHDEILLAKLGKVDRGQIRQRRLFCWRVYDVNKKY